ncbi:GNAT family N-acetyltransferase [Subtercola boreus]|uniref:GNAT family N-acetyltransferase n=1 Tax=Subtercola boreus TaxID=120213 RepID=A0A3E0WC76_9MICO|nr:GNAT family N-acetyltransferase [Subtercola boreus]RFA22119.1 GNAT family N-acetyltransferase [Subtercola boreus]RFA22299.1 GNAT family N-acetyltransferase [Subtercola boreus]RFA28163.1 GNAT family N-acetyltransferase [Subtercola boreus]
MATVTVRPVEVGDHAEWELLFIGYGQFYSSPTEGAVAARVWSWLLDPGHETEGFVAVDDRGRLLGLAHVREFARPLAGARGLYLDDLFVAPHARGAGVATSLLNELKSLAADRGLDVVRWITASSNDTAQRVYDKLADKTAFVTYNITV